MIQATVQLQTCVDAPVTLEIFNRGFLYQMCHYWGFRKDSVLLSYPDLQ